MSEWVKIDPTKFEDRRIRNVRAPAGLRVDVSLSPYDVPDAVRGYRDPTTGHFIIEFRYLDDEPWKTWTVTDTNHDEVKVRLGVNSRRLYGFEFDLEGLGLDRVPNVEVRVLGMAKRAIVARLPGESVTRQESYKVAEDILKSERHRIFGDLATA